MAKKIMISMLVLLFILTVGASVQPEEANAATVSVEVDGERVYFSGQGPVLLDGATYVPVRTISEKLGLKVQWIDSENAIKFTNPYKPNDYVKSYIGSTKIIKHVDGVNKTSYIDNAPKLVNSTTMVHIRFFEDAFDAKVTWDQSTYTASVYSKQLRGTQRLILSSLVYSKVDCVYGGTKFSNINFGYNSCFQSLEDTFLNVQKYLYMYTKDSYGNPISINSFMDIYLMDQWKVATYLDASDVSDWAYQASGYFGVAFYNMETDEYVLAYRGTSPTDPGDLYADYTIFRNKANTQMIYAEMLFDKVNRIYGYPNHIYVTGHSLGGYLAESMAKNHTSIDLGITFNGAGTESDEQKTSSRVINHVIESDWMVARIFPHYGTFVYYDMPVYPDDFKYSAHNLFNFYRYIYSPKTKYWDGFLN